MAYTFDDAKADGPAEHPVLRDVRQPRALPRRLGRRMPSRQAAVADLGLGLLRQRHVGAVQHRRGLLAGQRPREEGTEEAARAAGSLPGRGRQVQRAAARRSLRRARRRRTSSRATSAARSDFVYLPGTVRIREPSSPNTKNVDHTLAAEVEIPKGGAEGVLVCCGGTSAGYTLFMKDGKLHWEHNWFEETRYRSPRPNRSRRAHECCRPRSRSTRKASSARAARSRCGWARR